MASAAPSPLALSTVAFRREPVSVALKRARACGYEAIDLWIVRDFCPHFDPVETTSRLTDEFVGSVRESGLLVAAVTSAPPFEFAPVAMGKIAIQYAEESVKLAAKLGARVVSFPCFDAPGPGESADDKRSRIAEAFRRLTRLASDLGVAVAVEAPAPLSLCPDADAAGRLLEAVGDDRTRLALDSAHAESCGGPAPAAFRRLGPRVARVDLRDLDDEGDPAVPGDGRVDFAALLREAAAASYAGGFSAKILSPSLDLDRREAEAARARAFLAREISAAGLA